MRGVLKTPLKVLVNTEIISWLIKVKKKDYEPWFRKNERRIGSWNKIVKKEN
jgi:hypothetical protein